MNIMPYVSEKISILDDIRKTYAYYIDRDSIILKVADQVKRYFSYLEPYRHTKEYFNIEFEYTNHYKKIVVAHTIKGFVSTFLWESKPVDLPSEDFFMLMKNHCWDISKCISLKKRNTFKTLCSLVSRINIDTLQEFIPINETMSLYYINPSNDKLYLFKDVYVSGIKITNEDPYYISLDVNKEGETKIGYSIRDPGDSLALTVSLGEYFDQIKSKYKSIYEVTFKKIEEINKILDEMKSAVLPYAISKSL